MVLIRVGFPAALAACALALAPRAALALDPLTRDPTCSVMSGKPCTPTFCGVFDGSPCVPEVQYGVGQDLRLTIESRSADNPHAPSADEPLDSIRAMFSALCACWEPPPKDEAREGAQISVRLSFKRSGEIIGPPRVTYASKDMPADTRQVYDKSITEALARCAPLPFSEGLGGAIAGRPIAIRFVENRPLKEPDHP
jgi:hypothetical protein